MESKLQMKIIKYLETHGWYVLKVVACNKSGHPDITAFRGGKVIFIECKDIGKKPTKLQEVRHQQLRRSEFDVYVFDDYVEFLRAIDQTPLFIT